MQLRHTLISAGQMFSEKSVNSEQLIVNSASKAIGY